MTTDSYSHTLILDEFSKDDIVDDYKNIDVFEREGIIVNEGLILGFEDSNKDGLVLDEGNKVGNSDNDICLLNGEDEDGSLLNNDASVSPDDTERMILGLDVADGSIEIDNEGASVGMIGDIKVGTDDGLGEELVERLREFSFVGLFEATKVTLEDGSYVGCAEGFTDSSIIVVFKGRVVGTLDCVNEGFAAGSLVGFDTGWLEGFVEEDGLGLIDGFLEG